MTAELHPFQICAQMNGPKTFKVEGSKGDIYMVTGLFSERHQPECTCPAFMYHGGRCKHIKKLEAEACTWHQQWNNYPPQKEEGVCPNCGGPSVQIMCAV